MARRFVIPQAGEIKGGRLDGWRYRFLRFYVDHVEDGDGCYSEQLVLIARCTPPAWPFPCDIPLDMTHYHQLSAIRGERTKYLNAAQLIESAYSIDGYEMPPALKRIIEEAKDEHD